MLKNDEQLMDQFWSIGLWANQIGLVDEPTLNQELECFEEASQPVKFRMVVNAINTYYDYVESIEGWNQTRISWLNNTQPTI